MSKLVENYLLQQSIGKGVYGQVYRAQHQKNKGIYAVKVISKSSFKSNPKLQQLAINQINILSSIKHENIVKFIQTLKTPNNFYFVYEYCNQGTLENLLRLKKYLKQAEALIYFKQLLQAFKQLNKNNIMHRDLKPDNIFISDGIIKLGDFGFCKMLEVNMAQTMLGSPIYMAPQILKQQIYTSKADIWSLGVVLFEMLFGYCPFESSSISELVNKLKKNEVMIPHEINLISEETEILLRKMLVKDQFKRIQWADLFAFTINDEGKIIGGCKKEYAIQNLERYFLPENDNLNSSGNITNTISNSVSSNESNLTTNNSQQKYGSIKSIESGQKNNSINDQSKYKSKSQQYYPYTSGFIPYPDQQHLNKINGKYMANEDVNYDNNMMKKNNINTNIQPQFYSLGKLTYNKPELIKVQTSLKKKLQKQKFGQIHHRWLQIIKLIQDLILNNLDINSIETCIYILLKKLLQKLQKDSENYPQWTDVLIQQEMGIKKGLEEIQKSNKELSKLFDQEKQNRQDKTKKQLMKIWENCKNKFTLERAIKAIFDKQYKDITVEEILR